jgi:hypothetical protein
MSAADFNSDRRIDPRVPIELLLNAYTDSGCQRGIATNLSASGLFVSTPRPARPWPTGRTVDLEVKLPGLAEPIWAAGEICHDEPGPYFLGRGIRLLAAPAALWSWLREAERGRSGRSAPDPRYALGRRLDLRVAQSYWKPAGSGVRS